MAEVRIDITAEDRTEAAFSAAAQAVQSLSQGMKGLNEAGAGAAAGGLAQASSALSAALGLAREMGQALGARGEAAQGGALGALEQGVGYLRESLASLSLGLDVSAALQAMGEVRAAVYSLDLSRALDLDVSEALGAASQVKRLLDSIPDVTVKTVVMEFKTQASPVMPFSEGIRHIRAMMESLPTGGDYTMRVSGLDGVRARATEAPRGAGASGAGHVTYAPTINIRGAGGSGPGLAREVDAELARLWRYGRSELRRAMANG
ncbi:MAG: hypothetical protein Kow0025_12060 [Thermodesulfovibrionales bacterium]